MTKVLLLSRYARKGASSRLRFFQYLPFDRSSHLDVVVSPLLGDDYLKKRYSGGGGLGLIVLQCYWRRVFRLLNLSEFDLIWIEKELFPYFPAWLERLLLGAKMNYIVDYDDAVFHSYDMHRSFLVRRLLGRKIDSVMKYASLVTVGNRYLAGRARRAGAKRVEYLPTVVDLDRYSIQRRQSNGDDRVVIGWIGSPTTVHYLQYVKDALAKVCRDGKARVVVVGVKDYDLPDVPVDYRAWSEESEAVEIAGFDIGIMPLHDGPWERGKCGYKLIQYMACGKPVVASPVGVNTEIVNVGVNGFLASTGGEWEKFLRMLVDNAALRLEMGKHGRRLVEDQYCTSKIAPRLIELLSSI